MQDGSNSITRTSKTPGKKESNQGRRTIEQIAGSFDDKKRRRQYKARKRQLPANYHAAIN